MLTHHFLNSNVGCHWTLLLPVRMPEHYPQHVVMIQESVAQVYHSIQNKTCYASTTLHMR